MKKKSRKGKKRNISKFQRHLEFVQTIEGKIKAVNSFAGHEDVKRHPQSWQQLLNARDKWVAQKFQTAGKAMLDKSQNGAHNG